LLIKTHSRSGRRLVQVISIYRFGLKSSIYFIQHEEHFGPHCPGCWPQPGHCHRKTVQLVYFDILLANKSRASTTIRHIARLTTRTITAPRT
jgi:hypothetical protein